MNFPEHILEVLPAGCIVFDDEGQITYANPAFCEITGCNQADSETSSLLKFLTISSQIFYQTHLFPLLKMEGRAQEIFLTLKATSGTRIPVVINFKREEYAGAYQNIGVITTLWERQKYEQELLTAKTALEKTITDNQELTTLAAQLREQKQVLDRKVVELTKRKQEYGQLGKVLMHDLQEPMRKIGFFFDRVLSENKEKAGGQNLVYLQKIKDLITRLRILTDSVHRFVNHDTENEKVITLQVNELTDHAKSQVATKLGFHDFDISIKSDATFRGRKKDIEVLFFELLSNAVRFRDPDRRLSVKIKCSVTRENAFQNTQNEYRYTDHLQIEFRDNGTGFNSEHSEYIFGLFNKLHKNSEGVGLGLSLCEQIVSRHHGKISAQARPGQGATFVVSLPLS